MRIGFIGRFKPLHNGHLAVLMALCSKAEHVIIGLGSSNVYDINNPFTAEESRRMIKLALPAVNYSCVDIPDLHNGPKWREYVKSLFGKLDYFVTGNDYVTHLLKNDYCIIHPTDLIHSPPLNATMIRQAMLQQKPWEHLVPKSVVVYLKETGLVERFIKEFGGDTDENQNI